MTTTPEVPPLPDFCWPADTSCVPGWDEYPAETRARAVSLAGQTLRLLTGFRVGGCPVKVRPASRSCAEQTWRTYPAPGVAGSSRWQPVSLGGQWLNIACGHAGACGCLGAREVRLQGPLGGVVEVRVDGMVLDPSAYVLYRGGRLVRTDGDTWPLCQDLAAPDTEEGTWSVTYLPGAPVDGLGAYAAGLLAGEYAKACEGAACSLPSTVTQIARQGVTMTLAVGAFPEGKTGIREVDAFIESYNPHGLRTAPTVWSPDVPRHARTQEVLSDYTAPSGGLHGGSA